MDNHSKSFVDVPVSSERSFGLVFGFVFAVVGFWSYIFGGDIRVWSLLVSAFFIIIAFVYPNILSLPNKLWHRFGFFLGSIVSPLVMMVLFFLVITPVGFIVRRLGKDLLKKNLDDNLESYWIDRDKDSTPMGSMKNQY
jgi:hypothetical protein